MMSRISVIEMSLEVARSMAKRSEDSWTKVGAVALTSDNRIIATAYNGLLSTFTFNFTMYPRETRLPYMVHAEQNLCSLIKRGEASWCVITHNPCSSCLLLLASHGIRKIYYNIEYERDQHSQDVAKFYGIELIKV